jgi:23S rRNA (cytidine2498-2'-O)-methyltransferase
MVDVMSCHIIAETATSRASGGGEPAGSSRSSEAPVPGAAARATGCTGYLAAEGFEAELRQELGTLVAAHGRLLLAAGPPRPAAWAQNIWYDPVEIPIASIGDAARALRGRQRNWALYPCRLHRRAALIQAALPKVSARPLVFPEPAPTAPLGSWTLLEQGLLLAADRCARPFPNGEAHFVEDRGGPPSRAYLKLWEALTLYGLHPGPGQRCLDLGSSPGGWSWVLARLGASVVSIDKALLDPTISTLPGIEFHAVSAFALEPAEIGPVDWWFSDIVCYPGRLLRLVRRWQESGLVRRMICTLKFQGATDHAAAAAFADMPDSRLLHLYHNKHELTWMWPWPPR